MIPIPKLTNILLVEDDPEDVRIIMRALESSDMKTTVHVACDGVEAIDYLYQRNQYTPESAPRPNLILLDLNLPRVDGRAVLRELKYSADFRQIPVVILTTSENPDDVLNSYDLGVNSFMTKPVAYDKFVALIHDLERYWLELVVLPAEDS